MVGIAIRFQPRALKLLPISRLFLATWLCSLYSPVWTITPVGAQNREFSSIRANSDVDFAREVRPLLARQCFACHGPDEAKREADLRLDIPELATAKLPSGLRAIVPGEPSQSELILRVKATDTERRMPPAEHFDSLQPEQVATLEKWIAQGARYSKHWSFQELRAPALPSTSSLPWARNAIDPFVFAKLDSVGVRHSKEADKATLLRRLTLDLTGLPPTADEAREFINDQRVDAYERAVDRLLSSPKFGERFGRHWLDMARYADSNGYLGDELRPYAWLYRDWVIDAINSDMPFDVFTIEQFAGDLLPNASDQQRMATGFLRNSLDNTEAGSDREENRVKALVDRVSTLGSVWLGLSLACAECHAHKYDPITQKDFYSLFAFLNDADDVDMPLELPEETQAFYVQKARWDARRAELDAQFRQSFSHARHGKLPDVDELIAALSTIEKKRSKTQLTLIDDLRSLANESLLAASQAFEKHAAAEPIRPNPKVRVVAARKEIRPTFVHERGDYRRPREAVVPTTLTNLLPLESSSSRATRLDLARWLIAPKNPLTPRVSVNHVWRALFGRGLVATEDDFGVNGSPPTHPELLDWLAGKMIETGWSRKELVRTIVGSATYRQSSNARPDLLARDPSNAWLARQNRFRLEAEAIRDAALQASGLLTRQIGGRSIRPPQPAYITSISRNLDWDVSTGAERYRRGLYILLRRATPYPVQIQFDAPEATVACTQRQRTNSPLQALTLLNDPVFVECATELGIRLCDKEKPNFSTIVEELFYRCLGRSPQPAEIDRIENAWLQVQREMATSPEAIKQLLGSELFHELSMQDGVEHAAWIVLSRIVMNLDEFITRE